MGQNKYVGTHEFTNQTQRMVRFVEQGVKRKDAGLPYPYISKRLWAHLGQPYVLRITIEAVLPEDNDEEHSQ